MWFTGGQLAPAGGAAADGAGAEGEDPAAADEGTFEHWKDIFAKGTGRWVSSFGTRGDPPAAARRRPLGAARSSHARFPSLPLSASSRKTLGARARALAAKLLLGVDVPHKMEDDGRLEYALHRPVGGQGRAHIDVSWVRGPAGSSRCPVCRAGTPGGREMPRVADAHSPLVSPRLRGPAVHRRCSISTRTS